MIAGLRDRDPSTETALAELASTDLRAALRAAAIVAAGLTKCSPLASTLLDSLHAELTAELPVPGQDYPSLETPTGAFSVTRNHLAIGA